MFVHISASHTFSYLNIYDAYFINIAQIQLHKYNFNIKFKKRFFFLESKFYKFDSQTNSALNSKFYYLSYIISLLTTMNLRSCYADTSSVNVILPIHRARLRHARRMLEIWTGRRNGLPGSRVERIFSNSICPTRTLFLSSYSILGPLRYIAGTVPLRIHQSRVIKEEVGLSPGEWDRNVLRTRAERRCRNHGLEEGRSSAVAIKKRLRAAK